MKKYKEDIPFLLITIFMVTVFIAVNHLNANMPAFAPISQPLKIIVDAGHGGEDGGAVGVDGIVEKNINLNIALNLADMLKTAGFEVILTRDYDTALYDNGTVGIRNQKISDMNNRLAMIKANPDALLISIHQNKFPQAQYSGAQVFYNRGNQEGEILAKEMQKSLREIVDPNNLREHKSSGEEYFLLEYSDNIGVIVECGFLSNTQEAKYLADEDYQKLLAFAIFSGVCRYNDI